MCATVLGITSQVSPSACIIRICIFVHVTIMPCRAFDSHYPIYHIIISYTISPSHAVHLLFMAKFGTVCIELVPTEAHAVQIVSHDRPTEVRDCSRTAPAVYSVLNLRFGSPRNRIRSPFETEAALVYICRLGGGSHGYSLNIL